MSHTDKDAAHVPELLQCLRDALSALLEVRPANPLQFLLAHFRRVSDPDSLESLAYLLNACPRSRKCFEDQLHSAFMTLKRPKTDAVQHQVCETFLRHLASLQPLPQELQQELLEQLRAATEGGLVRFNQFCSVIEACLIANEALEGSQVLLRACGESVSPQERAQRLQSLCGVLDSTVQHQGQDALRELLPTLGQPPFQKLRDEMRKYNLNAVEGPLEIPTETTLLRIWSNHELQKTTY
ncbi:unnamed protein product [Cladocopium goreaui]|uniref:EF-hand domain-containing protein n=1 Tax=Cladocopium goreaui TaxID=2562237 RepID=A0A9P1C0Z9_9DINO|nr:unnamed protein product [Cladocopium goreaui]